MTGFYLVDAFSPCAVAVPRMCGRARVLRALREPCAPSSARLGLPGDDDLRAGGQALAGPRPRGPGVQAPSIARRFSRALGFS